MFSLKDDAPLNKFLMFVTSPVSHVEMWPYAASAAALSESHAATAVLMVLSSIAVLRRRPSCAGTTLNAVRATSPAAGRTESATPRNSTTAGRTISSSTNRKLLQSCRGSPRGRSTAPVAPDRQGEGRQPDAEGDDRRPEVVRHGRSEQKDDRHGQRREGPAPGPQRKALGDALDGVAQRRHERHERERRDGGAQRRVRRGISRNGHDRRRARPSSARRSPPRRQGLPGRHQLTRAGARGSAPRVVMSRRRR